MLDRRAVGFRDREGEIGGYLMTLLVEIMLCWTEGP